ncbi:hypothetical protein EV659_109148 [Rhodothalassium salexigens DSM 2132]|uniref:Uncharacterized protein n=1 Tax=Rhodothalassium salexigens DSM 2132 TaxID=1188247 RepID=A0A4R2PBY5_RHOSA|nr:hypothetical protein [Rhodothalassium salexigens]MBB4212195.1 hypothetical protein [Rhodothalassium salexigens DSM 2132]MBK1639698.1 hypothetical protein [Rhodothalassium salexigens DSM 2132]TCP32653.1 hypothetical protein EV659_109148 [Rhodothalassium salexigens DSM 2132]
MKPVTTAKVRMYRTESEAQTAVTNLKQAGFTDVKHFAGPKLSGKEEKTVHEAIEDGFLPNARPLLFQQMLEQGRSLVGVRALFGQAAKVAKILDAAGPVDTELLPTGANPDPTPLSTFLGMPVLWHYKTRTEVTDKPISSMLGLPLLAPRKPGWDKSFGMPVLTDKKTPLSSALGMNMLIQPGPKRNK